MKFTNFQTFFFLSTDNWSLQNKGFNAFQTNTLRVINESHPWVGIVLSKKTNDLAPKKNSSRVIQFPFPSLPPSFIHKFSRSSLFPAQSPTLFPVPSYSYSYSSHFCTNPFLLSIAPLYSIPTFSFYLKIFRKVRA